MNFEKEFCKIYCILHEVQKKSRLEGLLALENIINEIDEYPILKDGLRLVIDGTDAIFIEEYFDNILRINYPKMTKKRLLVELMKTGTLHIQDGSNIVMLNLLARSLCPIKFKNVHDLIKSFA